MRDKTPTMEVNNADTVTLDARMGRALREYLPVHFPQIIRYFTGQCNIEEGVKDTDEGDASGEESFDEDEEAEESAGSATDKSGSGSDETDDAGEYVVPSAHGATVDNGATAESAAPTSTAPTTAGSTTTKRKKTKAAPTKPAALPAPRFPLTPVESEWIGIMGFTPDRNPLVGPLDSSKLMSGAPGPVSPPPSPAAKCDPSTATAAAPATACADPTLLNIDSLPGYIAYSINTGLVHSLVGMRLNNAHSEYIAAGYTGHGMPVAFLAGKNIADLICGVASDPPIPAAYHPSRYNL